MEFDNYLRDGTNTGNNLSRFNQSKNVVSNNNNLKDSKSNKENFKSSTKSASSGLKSESKANSIVDISMLSLSGDDNKLLYKLPDSSELKIPQAQEKWLGDMRARRWSNRKEVCGEIYNLERRLQDISFDSTTGERYLMQTLDYRMDLEVSKIPLGSNFLQNTNITSRDRKKVIDCLYQTCDYLRADRYTVPIAMACADRYVKEKGRSLLLMDYTNVAISCWFLSCKYDLVYYPSIEDLCLFRKIDDPKTLIGIEVDILKTLNFFVSMPTPIEFLRPLTLLKQREGVSHNIAKLFIDISLYIYEIAAHPAHIIAAASYCLAMALSYRTESIDKTWTNLMKIFTGIDVMDIKPIINIIGHSLINTNFAIDLPALGRVHSTVIEVLSKRHGDILRLTRP